MLKFLTAGTAIFLATNIAMASDAQIHKIDVKMTTADGRDAGVVSVSASANGTVLHADLKNMTPGTHGFHIHENGSCADSFKAAGGHFNPEGVSHGINHGEAKHAGDLPNLYVSDQGTVKADVFAAVTFGEDISSLKDANGSAIIIHAKADTYNEDAGAGGREACGVIFPAK